MRTLLVGAGQIGRSMAAACVEPPNLLAVPWDQPTAQAAIEDGVDRFLCGAGMEPWALSWSAGKGIVGTSEAELAVQLGYLKAALEVVRAAPSGVRAAGRITLASSAGGIHAGGGSDIVTEASRPTPVSAYGRHKLREEQAVTELAAATGIPCFLARISNVYGPDQNMHKPQGFISHLCNATLRRDGFVLRVPADTIRDFVYASDVGRRLAGWIEDKEPHLAGAAAVNLVVSGRSTTLHEVIEVVRSVSRVPARITVAPLQTGSDQPYRTRYRPTTRPLDGPPSTPLAAGVHRTWQHLLRCYASAPHAASRDPWAEAHRPRRRA